MTQMHRVHFKCSWSKLSIRLCNVMVFVPFDQYWNSSAQNPQQQSRLFQSRAVIKSTFVSLFAQQTRPSSISIQNPHFIDLRCTCVVLKKAVETHESFLRPDTSRSLAKRWQDLFRASKIHSNIHRERSTAKSFRGSQQHSEIDSIKLN